MSDFLENFNKDGYQPPEKAKQNLEDEAKQEIENEVAVEHTPTSETSATSRSRSTQTNQEIFEKDEDFQKKKKRKIFLLLLLLVFILCVGGTGYYFWSRVSVPNFTGKSLTDAQTWATKNQLTLAIEQEYNDKEAANQILKQNKKAGTCIKKKSTLTLTSSLGPDPEAKIALPDFSTMTKDSTETWQKAEHAENVKLLEEYSDTVEKGKFIRSEFSDNEVTNDTYQRKNQLMLYFSKGKETYKKDIAVPDFSKKAKSEVEAWAKKNAIEMTYEEADSPDIPLDSIISQSIASGEKIAKKEAMSVTVSLGKAVIVPDFSQMSAEQAAAQTEFSVLVKSQFSDSTTYGSLISQSLPAGSKCTEKDDKKIEVLYSAGKPYLKNLADGTTLEGDLQKIFYDEFQSKGANIQYKVRRVASDQPKGTVVAMSTFNEYVPTNFTVTIDVSAG